MPSGANFALHPDWPIPDVAPADGSHACNTIGDSYLSLAGSADGYETSLQNLGPYRIETWTQAYTNAYDYRTNLADLEGRLRALGYRRQHSLAEKVVGADPMYIAPSLDTKIHLYHSVRTNGEYEYCIAIVITTLKYSQKEFDRAEQL